MSSPELGPSITPEESNLSLHESQYRIGFDALIPDQANEAGENEKTRGVEWSSSDGLETAALVYSAVYRNDDNGVAHTTRGDRLLDYKRTDSITGRVDQLTITERQGGLFVTEYKDMPSHDELVLAESEISSQDTLGVHPLAVHIVEECLVKDDSVADVDDLERAMAIIGKMQSEGFLAQVEEDENHESRA